MELQCGERVRLGSDGLLDGPRIFVENLLASGNDLRKYREAVTRGSSRKDRAVSSLFDLVGEVPPFRDCHRGRLGPVALIRRLRHSSPLGDSRLRIRIRCAVCKLRAGVREVNATLGL